MTANYNFQHNVLREIFESLPSHELKSIIITQDKARAKEIFYSAMKKSHLELFMKSYEFNCNFIIKNKLPILVYYFDNSVNGVEIIGECFASVVVAKDENHYYTLEYSFDNNLVLGEWQGRNHINHGFYSRNNIECIIDLICDLHTGNKPSVSNPTPRTTPQTNTLISSIDKIQKGMIVFICLLLVFMIAFPIIAIIVKNETIPYISTSSAKLTQLDANQKVYCEAKGRVNIIYIKEYNSIKMYSFTNESMYYSTSKDIKKGYATTSELKEYFGSNLISGIPPLSYAAPALIPIGITSFSILIIAIVFLSIILHKRAEAVLFTLARQNEMFIKNKLAFDNEIISKYEYDRIQKSLLSQKILKNNKLFSLFKYLY